MGTEYWQLHTGIALGHVLRIILEGHHLQFQRLFERPYVRLHLIFLDCITIIPCVVLYSPVTLASAAYPSDHGECNSRLHRQCPSLGASTDIYARVYHVLEVVVQYGRLPSSLDTVFGALLPVALTYAARDT